MTLELSHFSTDGHRLLVESPYSPAEIAKLSGEARQRVSEWRTGRKRPTDEARASLERSIGIPRSSWDRPPLTQPAPAAPPTPAPAAVAEVANIDLSDAALEALGLAGIERVISRLRAMEPTLPPRERVSCAVAEGRLHEKLVAIRQRDADARQDFFDSAEFRADIRAVTCAFPGSASELRARLARVGVHVAAPPPVATTASLAAPRTPADIDSLVSSLTVAREFKRAGEPHLARAHAEALGIDTHADAIAVILAERTDLAARLLDLLDPADERIVRAALERRMAIGDALRLPPESRRVIGALLAAIGREDIAAAVGG